MDEVFSPKSDDGKRGASPARGAFNLDAALELMQNGEEKPQVLAEVMRATSIWLGMNEDKAAVKPEDVKLLYTKSVEHADAVETSLRSSAIALLTQMIGSHPPPSSILDQTAQTMYTRRTIYKTIRGTTTNDLSVIQAQTLALRALTQEGVKIADLDGVVGWLVRKIQFGDEWTNWCSKNDDSGALESKSKVSSGLAVLIYRIPLVPNKPSHPPTAFKLVSNCYT